MKATIKNTVTENKNRFTQAEKAKRALEKSKARVMPLLTRIISAIENEAKYEYNVVSVADSVGYSGRFAEVAKDALERMLDGQTEERVRCQLNAELSYESGGGLWVYFHDGAEWWEGLGVLGQNDLIQRAESCEVDFSKVRTPSDLHVIYHDIASFWVVDAAVTIASNAIKGSQ